MTTFSAPAISPAYMGVGYIIGPRLAALNFAGRRPRLGAAGPAAGLLHGPAARRRILPRGPPMTGLDGLANAVWFHIVRPIAVGGMLVGAAFTLFRMRKNLGIGMRRAVADLKKSAAAHAGRRPHASAT